MSPGGPEDDGMSFDDDELAKLLDPEFASSAPISEPTAADRARLSSRAARAEDLRRRLAEEEARQRELERLEAREERRSRGGRASRRRVRIGISLVLLVAIGAALSFAVIRPSSRSSTDVESASTARPSGWPPRAKDESSKPLGTPPALPSSTGPFVFSRTQPGNDRPVAWDPCRPIHYVVNPASAPPGGVALLQDAIARTSAATGLQFKYEGTTTEPWSKNRPDYLPHEYGPRWAPVLITWDTAAEVPDLAGPILGVTQPVAETDPTLATRQVYVSGSVALDAGDLGETLANPKGQDASGRARAVIQHELGHLVGLDHVADPAQIMYTAATSTTPSDWGDGDRRGLYQLGTGDCVPSV
jgi:hypothetical protein